MYNNLYNGYGNPYYNMQPQPRYTQPIEQTIAKPTGLLGKAVDSIEVVKATDISLDGAINYFPLTDNSAIVTKQLQNDGTCKIVVYKPVDEKVKEIKYATQEDIDKAIKKIDLSDIKDDIDSLKKQIKKMRDKDE